MSAPRRRSALRMLRQAAGTPAGEVVIFPHAGAYPGTYHSLAERLPSTVSVQVVAARAAGAGPDEIAAALAERSEAPRMFAGHSLGVLLAWHVTAALADAALPDVLVLSAALSPDVMRERLRRVSGMDDAQLMQHLQETDALDGAAGDDRLRDYYLKSYRDDVRLAVDSLPAHTPSLGVPVLTMCGTEDPVASCAEVRQWEQYSSVPAQHVSMPGTHDYFYTEPQVATLLSQTLAAVGRAAS